MFGDYEAVEVIGKGGMGQVYKAIQRRLNRAVCVKTLLPQFASDPETSGRFAKEALTTAALSHPNIVSIFDVGTTPAGVAYFVMELIDGKSLRLILRDETPMAPSRAVMLMDQVLAALAEAHTHGIVHRDLKPANVLVVPQRDGGELCKLLDFGIARVTTETGERLTRAGMMVGTPGYMAPEQIVGEEVDHRADLYAAGAILYELLCGERVFTAADDMERFKKVLLEVPPPPSARTKSPVPRSLDAICMKALSRKASDRFASAHEFRDALARAIQSEPTDGGGFARGQIVRTPIAAHLTPGTSSDMNSRALVAAVLVANGEWERSRVIEPLERSLREAITLGDFKVLRTTITAIQEELKISGPSENLKLLFSMTREVLHEQLPVLLEWLGDPVRRGAGKWLLQLLGRGALNTYLELLPLQPTTVQRELLEVLRAIDPDASLTAARVRTLDAPSIRPLLASARSWPAAQSNAVFNAALQAADAAVRQAALESLDETTAFRFAPLVRQRLHDPSQPVRAEAMRWIARLEDEAAVPDLTRLAQRTSLPATERRAVWRTLGVLKSDSALELLALTLNSAKEIDDVAELARALVRSRTAHGLETVRAHVSSSRANPRRRAALEAALREGASSH